MPSKVLIVGKKKRRQRPPGHYAPKLKSLATVFELKIIIFVLNDLTVLSVASRGYLPHCFAVR